MKVSLSLAIASILCACGGGSGGGSGTTTVTPSIPQPTTPIEGEKTIVAFADNIKIGQAVDLFLYFPNDELSNIHWVETSNNSTNVLADTSKAIAFTPKTAGEYSFNASFTVNGSASEALNHTFTVSDETSLISARLGHAVLEGNKVSLRAAIDSTLSSESVTWTQTAGPNVTFTADNEDSLAVFFNAPEVAKDTLLTFEVKATQNGENHSDIVSVLVENTTAIGTTENIAFKDRIAAVFPYNNNSPYADSLVDCVYKNTINFSRTCTFNTLPLIAQDTITPTVDDIMDRVVVSHKWMGKRFRDFIENYDVNGDFKNLLRATTAIVISYDVRPSFYWAATGAIYLDANYFWLTPDERDTINQAPDFRAAFGNELKFVMPWRYVKDNDYPNTYTPINERKERLPDDAVFSLISLIYHELAHANDFFPSTQWFNYAMSERILDAVNKQFSISGFESDKLDNATPLLSQEMRDLAQVRFHGESPDNIQKSYTPSNVTQFFSNDQAPDFYNYSSIRENYAMLFDGFMMKARYGIDRDVAVTTQPDANGYNVDWGQRGRIGEALIKPKVSYVVERILPEFSQAQSIIDNLSEPIQMIPGKNWRDNLAISPTYAPKSIASAQVSAHIRKAAQHRPIQELNNQYYEKPLPKYKSLK
ncbi:MAG: hypothetical protein ACI9LM_003805 [Alteromonadaceae bacterium]|jgi:hypothetical protein